MTANLLNPFIISKRWSRLFMLFLIMCMSSFVPVLVATSGAQVKAEAGKDTIVGLCGLKLLDGSASSADAVSFRWNLVNGPKIINFSSRNAVSTFFQAFVGGDYDIELLVKDINGIESRDTVHYYINPLLAEAGDDLDIGACEIVRFKSDSSTLGDGYTYSWYPEDKLSDPNDANPTFDPGIFDEGKEFRFYFTVKDSFGCEDVDEIRINVGDAPLSDLSNSIIKLGCDSLMLDGSFSYGDNISYTWGPAAECYPNPVAPFMTNISNNVPSATLLIEDKYGCKDSSSIDLSAEQFYVNVGKDDTIGYCQNYNIRAQGTVEGNSAIWEPSELIGAPPNPLRVNLRRQLWSRNMTDTDTSKTFPFILKVERAADGCIETDTLNLTVYNTESTIDAGIDKTSGVCKAQLNGSVDSSFVTNINWTASVPVFNLTENTGKQVLLSPELFLDDSYEQQTIAFTLNATDNFGCRVSDQVNISVAQRPIITLNPVYYFPNGCNPVTINASTNRIDSLIWSPAADLDDPHSETPIYSGNHDEVLSVLAYDQYGCEDKGEAHIVWSPVEANGGEDISTVQFRTVSVGASENNPAYNYAWKLLSGEGASITNQDKNICRFVSAEEGDFELELSVSDAYDCTVKDTVKITVTYGKRIPIINEISLNPQSVIQGDSVIIAADAVSLDDYPLVYTWVLPDETIVNGAEIKVQAHFSGWVVLSVYDGFDTAKDSTYWSVTPEYPIESLEIRSTEGDTVCAGQQLSFSLEVQGEHQERLSYLWWIDDLDPTKIENLAIETGHSFTIYCKAFNSAEFLIDSFRVVVVQPEMLEMTDSVICTGNEIEIKPEFRIEGGLYKVYSGSDFVERTNNPVLRPQRATEYAFSRKNIYGCIDSATVQVDVYEYPVAYDDSLLLEELDMQGQYDLARNDSGAVSSYRLLSAVSPLQAYLTNDGDFTYNADTTMINGRESYVYEMSSRTCPHLRDTASVTVLLRNAEGLGLIATNGFSPNGDNVNDRFIIRGITDYLKNELYIYNKFGLLVYEAKPYQNDWDGTRTRGFGFGDVVPEGTYFYVLKVKGDVYLEGTIEIRR